METQHTIGFIGGGNMAEALIKGLSAAHPGLKLRVAEILASRRDYLASRYTLQFNADAGELARECGILILAVKPQTAGSVLDELSRAVGDDKLLISIVAGLSTAAMEKHFSGPVRIVRAMPNTPALVGAGATAICAGSRLLPGDMERAASLLAAVGPVLRVAEAQMDGVTGLSGSGPAYVFTLIEALADGGVQEGLPRETAAALAVQTVLGAAALVKATGEHPALLRDRVCSPGGTTMRGMQALEEHGFRHAVREAVRQAAQRSRELGCP
ncbi:MAG: pyrroline-5-carboxylate reductase [Deltaproteobacteria bacterium]|nr:pyrroline-5-carboxylate reductase [Deltaproteobacteria bacterium]